MKVNKGQKGSKGRNRGGTGGSLADEIERYIKERLENSRKRAVRLNRKQLARMFDCVPSQINYVLSTRFSAERGYYVESRRGGGGYLLITRVPISGNEGVLDLINSIPTDFTKRERPYSKAL